MLQGPDNYLRSEFLGIADLRISWAAFIDDPFQMREDLMTGLVRGKVDGGTTRED